MNPLEIININDFTIVKAINTLTIFDIENLSNPLPEIPENTKGVIIDLSKTEEIDSFGISIIVRLISLCKSNNKKFGVVVSNNKVLYILKIDRLDKILPLYKSIEEALENLKNN
ncbi:MAG: STAS domain-containing protein [Brevinematia bacterium]